MQTIEERLKVQPLGNDKSGYFPDGAHVVRIKDLPWTPFNLVGSEKGTVFKLMSVNWQHDMFTMFMNVPGGLKVEPHYHLGEAQGYIMTGDFEYEYGHIFAENLIGEGAETAHSAIIGKEDVLQFSIIFGGLAGVLPDGGPDLSAIVGCQAVYDMAKANNAADHIAPPPPGWKSRWQRD
jgi:2,4'-dihydroxyacetophenone dioxygenase